MSSPPTVAALFVQANGPYANLEGVELWDEERDARRYSGPHPAVAHPPCPRWGKLYAGQPLHIKRTGERKTLGEDGGCFATALHAIRIYGGVLEHPADSAAWDFFQLTRPPRSGGWVKADWLGGWTCCIEQGRYGHFARKPTWLYSVGCELPSLKWGRSEANLDPAVIARIGLEKAKRRGEVGAVGGGGNDRERSRTPAPFRDLLLTMARSAAT